MRQSAREVVITNSVNNFASFVNRTSFGCASESVMNRHNVVYFSTFGPDHVLSVAWSFGVTLEIISCSGISVMLCYPPGTSRCHNQSFLLSSTL